MFVNHPSVILAVEDGDYWTPSPSWHVQQFDISQYGGVVQGAWCFASALVLPPPLPAPTALLATMRLCHFLSSTVRGGSIVSSSKILGFECDTHYLRDTVLLPQLGALQPQGFWGWWCGRDTQVLTLSVFHSTKWSIRRLSDLELGNIFNVPKLFLETFKPEHVVKFWKSVPGNLVTRVWENLFMPVAEGAREGKPISLDDPPQSWSGCKEESVLRSVEEVAEGARESEPNSLDDRTGFDFSIAIKSDNADNPTFIWDDRIWALQYHDLT
jgi:hypothetical protein